MREILYRGKCTGDDDIYGWVDGYYVCLKDSWKNRKSHRIYTGYAECDCDNFYGDWYEVDSETVGQFTGRIDKNGNRIYEGDILVRNGDIVVSNAVPMLVKWDEDYAQFIVEYSIGGRNSKNILIGSDMLTIIGNIYDNPELMK